MSHRVGGEEIPAHLGTVAGSEFRLHNSRTVGLGQGI